MRLIVDECNCNALRKAARRVSQFYDNRMRPSGLRISQFTMLVIIWESKGISVNELAKRMALDRTTTGKNLRPLERDGLIRILVSATDRRSREVQLTERGGIALRHAAPFWRQAQAEFAKMNGAAVSARMRAMVLDLQLGDLEVLDDE